MSAMRMHERKNVDKDDTANINNLWQMIDYHTKT